MLRTKTDTPWTARPSGDGDGLWTVEDANGGIVFFGMEEDRAKLFAAAPELLEALRAVKKIVDDAAERPTGFLVADFQTATYPNSRDAYDGLCAAIAKAEGSAK